MVSHLSGGTPTPDPAWRDEMVVHQSLVRAADAPVWLVMTVVGHSLTPDT